jgi:serine/threonine-protein kinase HipA
MTGQSIQRLHCIDGCQALGLGVSMKYERPYGDTRDVQHIRDGASLPKLFTLIDAASPNPAADGLALLRWIIFQILIGNT